MTTVFIRETVFTGAYDWVRPNSCENFGIHGMNVNFWLKGPAGGISICIFTNWMLPQNQASTQEMYTRQGSPWEPGVLCKPWIADVSYHAREPQYKGQYCQESCKITGGKCYSDGSASWGDQWQEGFLHGGSDWLFSRMEDYYRMLFEGGPAVNLMPIPRLHPKDYQ